MRRVWGFTKQPTRKADGVDDLFKRFQRNFLRHKTDQGARRPKIADHVMTANGNAARGWLHNAADRGNQRGFACAIGAQQRQYFTFGNVQTDGFEGLKPGAIGFDKVLDRNDGRHGILRKSRVV